MYEHLPLDGDSPTINGVYSFALVHMPLLQEIKKNNKE